MCSKTAGSEDVKAVLDDVYPDRVFVVEEGRVWVSGMNSDCTRVAKSMVQELVANDIPAGLVYDDGAARFGGVVFNYGESA